MPKLNKYKLGKNEDFPKGWLLLQLLMAATLLTKSRLSGGFK